MEHHGLIWIDTDGKFKVRGFETEEECIEYEEMLADSGITCLHFSREDVMEGMY